LTIEEQAIERRFGERRRFAGWVVFWALCICNYQVYGVQFNNFQNPEEWLEKTGKSTERFYRDFPFFTCTEIVTQEKIGEKGKKEYRQQSTFDYLAFAKIQEDEFRLEESRLLKKIPSIASNKPSLLNTNGFPSLSLIFHPFCRMNYTFHSEADLFEGKRILRVQFQHIPGTRSTTALILQGRIYPLDLQGTAVIDFETGVVFKITADLVEPMKQINIEAFHVEVDYGAVAVSPDNERIRLPSKTVVELKTARQNWRNIHLFTQYKQFRVYVSEEISK
jgi:hypothetical protein